MEYYNSLLPGPLLCCCQPRNPVNRPVSVSALLKIPPIPLKNKSHTYCIDLGWGCTLYDLSHVAFWPDSPFTLKTRASSYQERVWSSFPSQGLRTECSHLLGTFLSTRATWPVPPIYHIFIWRQPSRAPYPELQSWPTASPLPPRLFFLFFLPPFKALLVLLLYLDYFLFLLVEFVSSTKAKTFVSLVHYILASPQ